MGDPLIRVLGLLSCCLALLPACGYAFTYGGGTPQRPTANVRVEPLLDLTGEGILAAVVTQRLRQRLGPPRGGPGELTLTGQVQSISTGNLPVFRPGGVAAGLSVLRVRGSVTLTDRLGRTVLSDVQREGAAELMVAPQVSQTEDQRRMALERASTALADEIAEVVLHR